MHVYSGISFRLNACKGSKGGEDVKEKQKEESSHWHTLENKKSVPTLIISIKVVIHNKHKIQD